MLDIPVRDSVFPDRTVAVPGLRCPVSLPGVACGRVVDLPGSSRTIPPQ